MTDHSLDHSLHGATDLSYGHLGEATYDVDESTWEFSKDPLIGTSFNQIHPLTQIQPSSLHNITEYSNSNQRRSQNKRLFNALPEIFPANVIASSLCRESNSTEPKQTSLLGQLFAVGAAIDVENKPGYRTKPVIAIAAGEAGQILRLLKPRAEKHSWGIKGSVGISMLDGAASEQGDWFGTGGTIHQITFSGDGKGASSWLAVRQASVTTIFRPMYHKRPVPAKIPREYGIPLSPSRVEPNPVSVLTAARTGSERHADVSFNPYYTRQFAVVDDNGSWSVWDIEGRLRKRSTLNLALGKTGNIYDGFIPNENLKELDSADGWHRILWVSSVHTIVVCNRRHLAIFDLKSVPIRLRSARILVPSSTDWILDIKRSANNTSQLFVLTSSRIYWVEVSAAREDGDEGNSGSRVLLSYRHFRDANDESLKLTVLQDNNISVIISSSMNLLLNYYRFSIQMDSTWSPTACHGSFLLAVDDWNTEDLQIQTLQFTQAPFGIDLDLPTGQESQYVDHNVKFYQVWAVSSNLSLNSTLSAIYGTDPNEGGLLKLTITAPTWKVSTTARRNIHRNFLATFVVADSILEGELESSTSRLAQISLAMTETQQDLHLRINWRDVFQLVFSGNDVCFTSNEHSANTLKTMNELMTVVKNYLNQAKGPDCLPISSFFELSRAEGFSEDLETAVPNLHQYLSTLQAEQCPDDLSEIVLSNLTQCSGLDLPIAVESPDLVGVYDRLGDRWMATLPLEVPNLNRLEKFKIARKLALELCLSSIAVSFRRKRANIEQAIPEQTSTLGIRETSLPASNRGHDHSGNESPVFSSQLNSSFVQDPTSSLPTPIRTPSIYSQSSGMSADRIEDPAISRLRQYVVSLNSSIELGKSRILSQWPSTPGADASAYNWESVWNTHLGESGEETDSKRQREAARRRRRTESFLNRDGSSTSEAVSQPVDHWFGSQPEAAHAVSSQTVDDLPMTQPDRGVFGSRSIHMDKKRQKKRRAAGF